MWMKKILLKCFLSILLIGFVGVPLAIGDPGQAFWSVYVGNYWNRSGSGGWTARDEFIGTETIGGQKTFKLDQRENGSFEGNEWYQVNLSEIKIWKKTYFDDDEVVWITITLSNGLLYARNPINVSDSWSNQSSATGCVGLPPTTCYPGTVTIAGAVQAKENVTTSLGTYHAFKVKFDYTVSAPTAGYFRSFSEYKWFVPYLGVIKWQSGDLLETELVTSMKIKKSLMAFDRDLDAKTDLVVYRKSTGAWFVKPSSGATPYGIGWGGNSSDIPVAGDYDGDGKTDIAIYRKSTGAWYIAPTGGGSSYGIGWGGDSSDRPAPGDYDGDGKTDIAVYRVGTGAWYIKPSSGATSYGVGWGGHGSDIPVPGDYDGDGKTDVAIYRPNGGAWYIYPSGGTAPYGLGWGGDSSDRPAPGDYDGDGKTDIAVYRSGTGAWYIRPSSGAAPYGVGWGGDSSDIPVPEDYDGDGKTDIAVYRTNGGAWYIKPSSGATAYGVGWGGDSNDVPATYNFFSTFLNP